MTYGNETWKIYTYKIQVNNLLIFEKIISRKVLHHCLATNTGEWRIRHDMLPKHSERNKIYTRINVNKQNTGKFLTTILIEWADSV